jgi:hypothetical protein
MGGICKGKRPGKRPVTEDKANVFRAACVRGARKSASQVVQLSMAQLTVRKKITGIRLIQITIVGTSNNPRQVRFVFCCDVSDQDNENFRAKYRLEAKRLSMCSGMLTGTAL